MQSLFYVVVEQLVKRILEHIHQDVTLRLLFQPHQHVVPQPLIVGHEHLLNVLKHPVGLQERVAVMILDEEV